MQMFCCLLRLSWVREDMNRTAVRVGHREGFSPRSLMREELVFYSGAKNIVMLPRGWASLRDIW